MRDTPLYQHELINRHRVTVALIVDFIEFTGSAWYGSRSRQAHAFAGTYPSHLRDRIVATVLVVMDNYGIDRIVPPRTVENAWNLALDSIGVDHEEYAREQAMLAEVERGGDSSTLSW